MAKQLAGVYERLIACGTAEFLEKGYTDASLRTIAEKAETSTSSIYVRFKDKEGLFGAIVEPAAEEFKRRFIAVQETFRAYEKERQVKEVGQYSSSEMLRMIDYIYDHFDAFRLLLDASHGTRFQHFVNELVELEEAYTYEWTETTGCGTEIASGITKELYHVVVTSYFEGVFEIVRHNIGREDAKKYVQKLNAYHQAGFWAIAGVAQDKQVGE